MARALVLNATYEALCVVSTRRALLLILDGKAELVSEGEGLFRSVRLCLPEPSIVRLEHYVKVPYQARLALNRRAVFARDGHRCQYCNHAAENIDHIVPRSRGGEHAWENVVASCRSCNARKEDRMLHESGMILRHVPTQPRERTWILAASGALRPDWEPFLAAMPAARLA